MNSLRPFIRHFTLEFWLDHGDVTTFDVEGFFGQLIQRLDLHVVNQTKHIFENGGMTKVCILSTSHIALHTWPEFGYNRIDLLSCKDISKSEIESVTIELLREAGQSTKYVIRQIEEL